MGADGILVRGRRECGRRSDHASKTGIMKSHSHKLEKRYGSMGLFAFIMLAMWMQARTAQGSMRIALTSHFSDREDCHRGFQVKFEDFDLGSALRQVADLPPEWTEKFLRHLKVGSYSPSKVARYCSLNGENFTSVADMGYYVCHNAINIEQGHQRETVPRAGDQRVPSGGRCLLIAKCFLYLYKICIKCIILNCHTTFERYLKTKMNASAWLRNVGGHFAIVQTYSK